MTQIEAEECKEMTVDDLNLPKPVLFDIRRYPDPILKTPCEAVAEVDDEIKAIVQNMFITMYYNGGVGLSANQCGISKRIMVMDTTEDGSRRQAFINPKIIYSALTKDRYKEGCLSFPDVFVYVERAPQIKVEALNEKGETFELELEGIDAICFQHELDHLNGVTFLDHLSQLKLNMLKKKLKKLKG